METKENESPLKKIREFRRLKQRQLAQKILPPDASSDKIKSLAVTISQLELGKKKWREDYLDIIAKALDCSRLHLLGEKDVDTLINPPGPGLHVVSENQYPINDEYIRYAMEIVDDLVDAEELTKEGRVEILSEVYKVVYDFYEKNHNDEEYKKFIREIEKKNAVNKGFLNFVKKHKSELY